MACSILLRQKKLPSLTSNQLVFFVRIHIKQVSRPTTKSQVNEYIVFFLRDKEGKVDAERGVYDTNNQTKRATFKYEQEGQFVLV